MNSHYRQQILETLAKSPEHLSPHSQALHGSYSNYPHHRLTEQPPIIHALGPLSCFKHNFQVVNSQTQGPTHQWFREAHLPFMRKYL